MDMRVDERHRRYDDSGYSDPSLRDDPDNISSFALGTVAILLIWIAAAIALLVAVAAGWTWL